MKHSTRVSDFSTTKWRKPGMVMQLGPPWSTTVVTPDRTPTMSAFRPKRPVTC